MQAPGTSADTISVNTTQDTATIQGKWQLMLVLASDTAAGKIPELIFDLSTKRFSGNTGCNSISGGFFIYS